MQYRQALISDIPLMQVVRNSVKENALSNPELIKREDYVEFISTRGKGWVCELDKAIIGFSIADLKDNNVWALFILPGYEGKGIGRQLHDLMLDWYFKQDKESIWLSTAPGTRAEQFYRKAGWTATGLYGKGEIKFEMNVNQWRNSEKTIRLK